MGHPALVLRTSARLRITAAAHATLEALETRCVDATFAVKASTFGYDLARTTALDDAERLLVSATFAATAAAAGYRLTTVTPSQRTTAECNISL